MDTFFKGLLIKFRMSVDKTWFLLPGGAAEITVHKGQLSPKKIVITNEDCGGSKINEEFLQIWKDICGKSKDLFAWGFSSH